MSKPNTYAKVKQSLCARVALIHKGSVLVVRDLRRPPRERFYSLPGGHIDPGEIPAEAANREFAEEMGFAATLGEMRCVGWNTYERKDKLVQEVVFYFTATSTTDLPADGPVPTREQHLAARMIPLRDINRYRCLPKHLFALLEASATVDLNGVVYVQERNHTT